MSAPPAAGAAGAAVPGLESRVGAPAFVPGAPPGLASASAKPFVPFVPGSSTTGSVAASAKPFVPGGGGGGGSSNGDAGLARSASANSMASGAVHAPIFVPGGAALGSGKPAGVNAPTFVPGGSGSNAPASRAPSAAGAAPSKPPKPAASPAKPPGRGSRPSSQAGRAVTPPLPEGDDLLGMSAVTPGDARDVAAQAAEMFKSLQPFQQQQQQHAVPPLGSVPAGGGRNSRGPSSTRTSPRPSSGGGMGPPPPGFVPTTAAAAAAAAGGGGSSGPAGPGWGSAAAGGRGGGRGGRHGGGGGRGQRRPGGSRPSSAYTTTPGRMQKAGMFLSEQLRQELQQRSFLIQAQVNPEAEGDLGVPPIVQAYHTLYPLEDVAAEGGSQALGVSSQVVKAVSGVDGQAYALRRIDPRQVIPTAELLGAAEAAVARWEAASNHPNVAGLREAFVSDEWDGSPALFFAHDYHPGAYTLEQAHILPSHTSQGLTRNPASEEQLWSYLVQLASALRCIHAQGLAARPACLMPSKVLLTSAGRVRLGSLGVPEVLLESPGYQDVGQLQRGDLSSLGNLVLLLACVGRGAAPSLEYLTTHFSREFCHIVAGLLASAEGSGFASCSALLGALGDRVVDEMDSAALYSDSLLGEVQREADNGRLLRLLLKLCYVCERPELGGDTQWAETGDRYLLKLFRDFVFYQVDEEGAPLLDWGLAAEALNKADAGVPEKVLLMSRDELSMLVVSYADVRRCVASCYEELRSRSSSAYPAPQPGGGGGGGSGAMNRSRSRPSMQQQQQQQH
ncbi:PAB-dependent poly(A)-specific ribonuclease subunit 3 [Micractinium conductrix]|uniref:PAB-dependent poly(A)-specific ribonuclease subunit 3 n=1 Tax=Micractinium conductrix TaxID=554055 RepID=A0A2P6VHZ2_9CHLO|nr:PAB-dependent poly(A)-specific ribonuclease subunit 3 [Micractinium conductrix]|eukprot:PSC73700.1 PAB-dependent poly(A)-specific ribonuclease subunit 3 [Micractinium conductrix]